MRLVEVAPASGSLALWVAHRDVTEAEALAHEAGRLPAYTDGRCIHYTPAFERLGLDVQTGWVAHELLHIALRHGPRYRALQRRLGDVDLALFNRCADAIVNSALAPAAWLALPAQALTLPQLLDQVLGTTRSDEAALLEWDVERLYAAVDDRRPPDQRADARKDGPRAATLRTLGGPDSEDLKPGPEGADAVVAEAEQAREWGERLLRGHSGDGAFSILPILLLWVYLLWVVVLLGAVIAAYAPVLLGRTARPWAGPGVEFRQALRLLEALDRARRTTARGRDLDTLSEALAVDALVLEPLMDDLAALGWVSRLDEPAPQRWVLLVDLHETPAAPLVDALLLKPDPALAAFRSRTGLDNWRLAELMPLLNEPRSGLAPASP